MRLSQSLPRPLRTSRTASTPIRLAALSIAAVLLLPALTAAQYNSSFGKNKVRYGSFDWQIYHSQHFDVWYYPKIDSRLETVVSLAESAYDELSRAFDFQIQEPTPLILYATHSEFLQNNIIVNFIPEGVGAFATPARFRMVMPIDLPDDELYELVLHELTHIFQYHIIFGGGLGRSLTLNPPQWLIEGMASYYADDESSSDKMFLRDAVVNDRLPPVTSGQVSGFFAYRYGHAVFDFMEERWGKDGVIDFIFEFRNTIGSRVGRAVERAFRIDPEDFDLEFRRWLRQKYLPELVETGEPSDFGKPFRTERANSQETSPIASPSGDLVAAFSTAKQDLDLVLFDAENRRYLRNLTKGNQLDFRFFVAQHVSVARRLGRDIAFSPDGNQLAAFVRKEAGYSLALVDVLKGGIDRIIDMEVEQQRSPAWSPDGNTVAFSGNLAGDFDIFLLDLRDFSIRNLTNDTVYDGAPAFSPDGKKLVFASKVGESSQLFEVSLENPAERTRLTNDEFHNTDPTYSPDGETIYFTSDRSGAENIYGIHLERKELAQFTNAITGCFQPTVLNEPGKQDRLVYTGYWKGRFDLYETDITEPISVTPLEEMQITSAEELPVFEPDILVSIDESNKEDKKGFKLFLEDAYTVAGINDNSTLLASVVLQFSDFLGDRRLFALVQSIEQFAVYRVGYTDLSRRWQWGANLYSEELFFTGFDLFDGRFERIQRAFKQQGALFNLTYPLSFTKRFEFEAGFELRDINFSNFAVDSRGAAILDDDGNPIQTIFPREDEYPVIGAAFVSDTTIFGSQGPTGGHRIRLSGSYSYDTSSDIQPSLGGESDTLASSIELDARKYVPLTRRSLLATRLFATSRGGEAPTPVYFGGFDTLRGVEYRDQVGDHGFFANIEFRFPLIDFFVTPVFSFQGIQGRVFLDVGGAWFDDVQDFDLWDSENDRLDDAIASYGFGLTVNFLGVDLHWDFGKRWDFDESGESFTNFWIGRRF